MQTFGNSSTLADNAASEAGCARILQENAAQVLATGEHTFGAVGVWAARPREIGGAIAESSRLHELSVELWARDNLPAFSHEATTTFSSEPATFFDFYITQVLPARSHRRLR